MASPSICGWQHGRAARRTSTSDIDIEWRAEEGELLDTLLDAVDRDLGDFFVFAIERAGAPEDLLGGSHRYRVSATLAGRPFEAFLLDVGLRSDEPIESETLRSDGLLGFAGIGPVEVAAVPLEVQTAEKLHAYTRTYEGGRTSTRVKDLVDLALIAELSSLDAGDLRRQAKTIFSIRRTHPLPAKLPPPPADWTTPFRRLAQEVGAPPKLEDGHRDAAALLDAVLSGDVTAGTWIPDERRWEDNATTTATSRRGERFPTDAHRRPR